MFDSSTEAQRLRAKKRWRKSRKERFWDKVDKSGRHWIWKASIHRSGYGSFRWSSSLQLDAHVASFLLSGRKLKRGQVVMHKCDIKLCVRPRHLKAGTQRENVQDMIRKGRRVVGKLPSQVGECNHGSKLTEGVVRKIKSMYKRGDSQACISRKTKVPRANIWAIVNNKSWAHVTL